MSNNMSQAPGFEIILLKRSFFSGEPGGFGTGVSRVVDAVSVKSTSEALGLIFLGKDRDDVAEIGGLAAFGDVGKWDE